MDNPVFTLLLLKVLLLEDPQPFTIFCILIMRFSLNMISCCFLYSFQKMQHMHNLNGAEIVNEESAVKL